MKNRTCILYYYSFCFLQNFLQVKQWDLLKSTKKKEKKRKHGLEPPLSKKEMDKNIYKKISQQLKVIETWGL